MPDDISQTTVDEQQPASPANQSQGGELSPEELEFSKLSGSAQERFRAILRKNRELSEQTKTLAAELESRQVPTPPQQDAATGTTETPLTAEQEQAIENLRKFGVWTKKDQEELELKWREEQDVKQRELEDNILIETEYARLEASHDGGDGLPRFDREAIEEYMRETGVYNPEKAYEDLYRDEIFDSWAKNQSGGQPQVYTERPRVSVGSSTEPLSMDGLRERLRQPDGRDWWEKNRDRLLPVIGDLFK